MSPENSRHVFDDRKLKELAQSIKAQGIKVRLIVRQGDAGKFEIVAGARRYRAAQPAGQAEVPWEVREHTDAEARDACLIENLQRADLTPLEEAESYQQLVRIARGVAEFLSLMGARDSHSADMSLQSRTFSGPPSNMGRTSARRTSNTRRPAGRDAGRPKTHGSPLPLGP